MNASLGTTAPQRLSVPPRRTAPPRPLTDAELATLLRIADALIPEVGPNPKGSAAPDYVSYLGLALAARSEAFSTIMAGIERLSAVADTELRAALKQMWAEDRPLFDAVSSVVAGAYFMTPEVKKLIGYPGQRRDPAPLEEAADELGDGLLDPVIERGHIYVSAAGE